LFSVKPLTHILVYRKLLPFSARDFLYNLVVFCKNIIVDKHFIDEQSIENFENLKEDGFVELAPLDDLTISNITREIRQMPFKKIMNKRGEVVKHVYDNADLVQSTELLSVATNDGFVGTISEYFGCLPKIQYLAAWETLKNDDELAEMFFHMDHHGHKFVKLFLYLSDVNLGDGHHEFVKGSHDWRKFNKILSVKNMKSIKNQVKIKRKLKGDFWMNNEAVSQFLQDRVIKVTGQAGSLFMEDTGGLHRGTKVESGQPRLLFQVLYTPIDSGKDPCYQSKKTEAFEICRSTSKLQRDQFEDMCSLIVE
jgi:hypothetical protein